MKPKLSDVYWPLRLSYGLVPLLAGLDINTCLTLGIIKFSGIGVCLTPLDSEPS